MTVAPDSLSDPSPSGAVARASSAKPLLLGGLVLLALNLAATVTLAVFLARQEGRAIRRQDAAHAGLVASTARLRAQLAGPLERTATAAERTAANTVPLAARWEFRVEFLRDAVLVAELNRLGGDGWEIVDVRRARDLNDQWGSEMTLRRIGRP